jgi:hypothetical protein
MCNCSFLLLDQKKRTKEKSSSLEGSREIGMKSTCGRRSKKQPNARSPKASLFVHYAAKRNNNTEFKTIKECARGLGKRAEQFVFP